MILIYLLAWILVCTIVGTLLVVYLTKRKTLHTGLILFATAVLATAAFIGGVFVLLAVSNSGNAGLWFVFTPAVIPAATAFACWALVIRSRRN